MLAAGGWLAHLPEPRVESLKTDLETVIKLFSKNTLIQIIAVFLISSMSCDPVTPIKQ